MKTLPIPKPGNRLCIIGTTGSGKTVAALFHLAMQDWDKRPWFVLDFKGDEHIARIDGAQVIDINDDLPTEPGIYIVRPFIDDVENVDNFLMRIYERENVGVWIDEGYEVAKSRALRRLLTQGRSKRISVIFLVQRPRNIDLTVLSEAQYYQLFEINYPDDQKHIQGFWKRDVDITQELPEYHSWWFDRKAKTVVQLGPMPDPETSLDLIAAKMPEDKKEPPFRFL